MKHDFRADSIELNIKVIPEMHPVRVIHLDSHGQPTGSQHDTFTFQELTPREKEVIGWMVQGKTNWEISMILNRSEATIKTHVQHIMAKLRTTSRTQTAALWASMRQPAPGAVFQDTIHGHKQ